ncbi:unnamed protein product, partial [Prorocentrum cordatum]
AGGVTVPRSFLEPLLDFYSSATQGVSDAEQQFAKTGRYADLSAAVEGRLREELAQGLFSGVIEKKFSELKQEHLDHELLLRFLVQAFVSVPSPALQRSVLWGLLSRPGVPLLDLGAPLSLCGDLPAVNCAT